MDTKERYDFEVIDTEKLKKISADDIISAAISSPGAMGCHHTAQLVVKNDEEIKCYRIDYLKNDGAIKILEDIFPAFDMYYALDGNVKKLKEAHKPWIFFYLGFGNKLLIQPQYEEYFRSRIINEKMGLLDINRNWVKIFHEVI